MSSVRLHTRTQTSSPLNLVIKISLMFAQYFEYYAIILRGAVFFVDTVYIRLTAYMLTIKLERQK